MTSVTASTEKSKFLVGTVGTKNNVVCLLDFDEEKSEIIPTLFDHPNEIWDIVSCPSDESLFFTCHSPGNKNLPKIYTNLCACREKK